jgi:Zn-dependent M28 family amino/carboxypeptidase
VSVTGLRARAGRWSLLALTTVGLLGLAARPSPQAPAADRFMQHVAVLASDGMKGRGNGMAELNRAADYIAAELESYGLRPLGDRQTFFQDFPVTFGAELGPSNALRVGDVDQQPGRHFVTLPLSSSGVYEGGVVFAGYGITAPELRWDDYEGIDVSGKAVIVFSHYPGENLPFGAPPSAMTSFEMKVRNARRHGARAVLFVLDANSHSHENDMEAIDPIHVVPHDQGVPAAYVSRAALEPLFAKTGRSIAGMQDLIERSFRPHSFELAGAAIRLVTDVRRATALARNVVAALPGADAARADEWIVVGAHYDHLGLGFGSLDPTVELGKTHHGADDNASGTAGLLELARRLSRDRATLKRSVLFVAFAGEEIGLMGSSHFVNAPPVPLRSVSAMLNLDMIGRLSRTTLNILGARIPDALAEWIREENQATQLNLAFSPGEGDSSDWAVFQAMGVPAITFFTGIHEDYHRPSDTIDKINVTGAQTILALVERTARRIVAADSSLRRLPVRLLPRPPSPRPHLGAEPVFSEPLNALRFDNVPDGSPAARAGLQQDDVIVALADEPMKSVVEFQEAMASFRPGDVAVLTVRRGGRRVRLTVTVGATDVPPAERASLRQ